MRAPWVSPIVLTAVALLTSCSSSNNSSSTKSVPIFTSAPVTEATQGTAYTYQLAATDPAGGSVTFALTTAPSGATLTGNTVNWTPTAAESRISNNFTATATTSSAGSAQQSWTVTPGGTITVNWVTTYWSPSGQVQVPEPASAALNLEVLVAEPDGSINLLKGSATSTPGVFTIANVPGGNYWLAIAGNAFWTNTSTFDAGTDIASGQIPFTSTSSVTMFDLSLSGMAAESTEDWLEFTTDPQVGFSLFGFPAGTATGTGGYGVGSTIDWTQINLGFALQYELESLGPLNNYVLGPELTLTNLSWSNGTTNTISGTLNPASETSVDLSVTGSQWASAFNNVGPVTATVQDSIVTIAAQPYVTAINASSIQPFSPALVLVGPTPGDSGFLGTQPVNVESSTCQDYTGESGTTLTPIEPPILTDQDFGTLQYGDPFDPTWTRTLALCQQATVPITFPNSSNPYSFLLVDGTSIAPSSSSLVPLAIPVQSPTIDGASFFTANTVSSASPTISWSAPSGTPAPYGYTVRAYAQTLENNEPSLQQAGNFSTSGTSVTLPPLAAGNTYLFSITTKVDGAANMQTSPFRSALPTGFASIVSAPITISPTATTAQVRGDIEEWRRLVQPRDPQPEPKTTPSSCFLTIGTPGHICEFRQH
jgi:hypothetical protein